MTNTGVPSGIQISTDTERETISVAMSAYPVTYVSLGGTITREVEGDMPKVLERDLSLADAASLYHQLGDAIQQIEQARSSGE